MDLSNLDANAAVNIPRPPVNSTSIYDGFEGQMISNVTTELLSAAWFEYTKGVEVGPCSRTSTCSDKGHKHSTLNNPFTYSCKSLNFHARILEGRFKNCEVYVTRAFAIPLVNPTNGTFMFPGRRFYVSGAVEAFRPGNVKTPVYFNLIAKQVSMTPDIACVKDLTCNQQIHRFQGSIVNLTEDEMKRQNTLSFIC